ncbi:MAG: glycosyltransferase family 4 protein, partial [Candidatus Fermentibacteraceae bacterium]|nr:glycosyltransferase family 4 protein [Candidatus Fermentibacteraceae bacterium]
MRIGFDVSSLHGYGGINRYSRQIVASLMEFHPEHSLVLFSSFSRSRTEGLRRSFGGPSCVVRPVLPNPLALGGRLRKLVSAVRGAILEYCARDLDVLHLTRPFADRVFTGNLVLTVHDLFPLVLEEYRGEEAEREFGNNAALMLENAAAIITPSKCIAGQVEQMFPCASRKLTVVPHAASVEFRPTDDPPLCLSETDFGRNGYFLYVGSAYPRKNLPGVIQAFEGLPAAVRRRHGLVLVLTGVERHIRGLTGFLPSDREDSRIVALRGLPTGELVRLYSSSTALVFPSLGEGFGLPVLEAMQCGCPVITSDLSCLPEVAGGAAMLVDPGSPDSIREAMERMATEEGMRERLASAGLERARCFSWRRTA